MNRHIIIIVLAFFALQACVQKPEIIPNKIDSERIAVEGDRIRNVKRLLCFDLDATLTAHRTPLEDFNRKLLDTLSKKYHVIMVGAGNCPRIYKQMGEYPIEIIGNYGMQRSTVENGEFKITREIVMPADTAFFMEQNDYLRKKYGYTEFSGEPLEFHRTGMVTMGLLGTAPELEAKKNFDPDRSKRRKMYPEVCKIFKDYSVYIGGSSSFDFSGKQFNKYDAIMEYAAEQGYALDQILFIGDDFGDGGGDSHVRIKGMDYIEIEDYHKTPEILSFLYAGPDAPHILAHRGYFSLNGERVTDENSIEALRRAQEAGIEAVEFDIHQTADDSLIVNHNQKINDELDCQKSTFAELRAYTLPFGNKMPTLHEWLVQASKSDGPLLYLEIKSHATPEAETKVVKAILDEVHKMGMQDRMRYLAFSHFACEEIMRLEPTAKVTLNSARMETSLTPDEAKEKGYAGISYHAKVFDKKPEWIARARELGLETYYWMVDTPELARYCKKVGVSWFTTNYYDLMAPVVR